MTGLKNNCACVSFCHALVVFVRKIANDANNVCEKFLYSTCYHFAILLKMVSFLIEHCFYVIKRVNAYEENTEKEKTKL